MKPAPKVYIRQSDTTAIIGPAGAWEKGDEVSIPGREPGTLDGLDPGAPAFDGRVMEVHPDRLATVRADTSEESW